MSLRINLSRCTPMISLAALFLSSACLAVSEVHEDAHDHASAEALGAKPEARAEAAKSVEWKSDKSPSNPSVPPVRVKILGFNDFHGQISAGRFVGTRPVGSAPVFAAYLKAAMSGMEDSTIIANAGDNIGASPLSSALLRDEPTLSFYNMLGNEVCSIAERREPHCNMIGTPGNHEFDKGREELLRQLTGGNAADGPFLENPWRGIDHSFISANVVSASTGKPLFKPYAIKRIRYVNQKGEVKEMPVGFIGALLKDTPTIVTPSGVAGLQFLDEATAINRYAGDLKQRGVETIVVLIHQGGFQTNYIGDTDPIRPTVSGEIAGIVKRLDPEIDLVVSGHTHAFTNALLPASDGTPVLVTQAFSEGTAYSDIDLLIDPVTRDVVSKSARIVTTFADAGPGLTPDAQAAALVAQAEAAVAPLSGRVIGTYTGNITRSQNAAGESALGNLIADAQRARMGTDFAFMNPGGIRADLLCGAGLTCNATYGNLFTVQPFGNSLVRMDLTGEQVYRLLEQQFPPNQTGTTIRFLQVSGLSYTWDNARVDPLTRVCTACIAEVRKDGFPINRLALYSVTVNSFMATGGDRFAVLIDGTNRVGGPLDIDALVDHIGTLAQPFAAPAIDRIVRQN
jgi:5'-nucleotidase